MTPEQILQQEFCYEFTKGMQARMLQGFYRYGPCEANVKTEDLVKLAQGRIDKYLATGNTEHLLDAGNFLMLEFRWPKAVNAHFKVDDGIGKIRPRYWSQWARQWFYRWEGD